MKSILNRIFAIARREVDRISSRRLYLLAVLVFPVLSILFFTSIMKDGVPTRLPIAVVDLDQTLTSRKFVRNINVTQGTAVVMQLNSENEAMKELRKTNIYGFVVLPKNMQADIMTSRQPVVSYYYQNGFLIAGGLVQNDLTQMLHTLSAGIDLQKREAMGQSEETLMASVQPIKFDAHMLFNPETNYPVYVTSIMLPIMLQLFILMITVYSIGIEIKEHSSREWLKMADKSIVVALAGKLLPYTIIFLVLMTFQNLLLYRVLMVPLNVNMGWMIFASGLFVLAYQAIGVFFVGLLPLMRHSLNLAAFYGILALTLVGFSFPAESMHPVFQAWAGGFPARHYMHIFQNQMLAGFEPYYALKSYVFLMLFLLLPFTILGRLKSALIYQNFIEDIHKNEVLT
jgi:ABC-2 type transport system permease protein